MKVGKMGMKNILEVLYEELGYKKLQYEINYALNIGVGLIFSIC